MGITTIAPAAAIGIMVTSTVPDVIIIITGYPSISVNFPTARAAAYAVALSFPDR